MFNNEEENKNIEENSEIEIVFGDASELEFSDVQEVAPELKPEIKEKKKNIVIPVTKSQSKHSSTKENKDEESNIDVSENEE